MALKTGEVTKQQKVVLGILGVIGLIFLYSRFYVPMGYSIKDARSTLQNKIAKLGDMRMKSEQLPELEKQLEILAEHLKKTEKKLPKTEEIPTFIKLITRIAERHGMEVKTLSILGTLASQYYIMHPYEMNLQADYHTFGRFFAEIGQLDRIFNIENLTLNLAGGDTEVEGLLNANFTLVAFTFK